MVYSDEYVLASGKRLVIEQAYLLIQTVAGSQTIAYIRVYNQGPAGTPNRSFPILLTKQGTSGNFDGYVASGPTKLYVTGPVMLRFELFDSAPGNFIATLPSISGYLEPAQ